MFEYYYVGGWANPRWLSSIGACISKGANKQGVTREISIDELKEHDGIKYLEEWGEANPFTGTAIDYLKYESRLEIPYVRGKKHGIEMSTYKEGAKREEIPWVNGKKHGRSVYFYENGTKREETLWSKGKKHGMEIHYRKDGTKLSEEVYKNGKYISFKKF